jgi:hypothetical protein
VRSENQTVALPKAQEHLKLEQSNYT